MEEPELRKLANEVWSNAATIDGLMRCLDPIVSKYEDLAIAAEHGRKEERAKWINDDCVWGQGECIPDCPSCKRMDDLYRERRDGYREGLEDSIQVINTHRMGGYICSCGAEINSMEGHYEQQIRMLKEGG